MGRTVPQLVSVIMLGQGIIRRVHRLRFFLDLQWNLLPLILPLLRNVLLIFVTINRRQVLMVEES